MSSQPVGEAAPSNPEVPTGAAEPNPAPQPAQPVPGQAARVVTPGQAPVGAAGGPVLAPLPPVVPFEHVPASPGSLPHSMSSSMSSSMTASWGSLTPEGMDCYGNERQTLAQQGRFYNNSQLSDVKIRVGERTYHAHKIILVRGSDVFERMLSSAWEDSGKQVPTGISIDQNEGMLTTIKSYLIL